VVKGRSCYPPQLGSNTTPDMFTPCGLIGVKKVPIISLLCKCLRVGLDVSKHFSQWGLDWVWKSCYSLHLGSNIALDMFTPYGPIGVAKYQQSHSFLSA
jgi:hypothetical protein